LPVSWQLAFTREAISASPLWERRPNFATALKPAVDVRIAAAEALQVNDLWNANAFVIKTAASELVEAGQLEKAETVWLFGTRNFPHNSGLWTGWLMRASGKKSTGPPGKPPIWP